MSDVQDHPEYRGLLAAVRAAPDDDLPRLVLADWLEEHGSPDWAEFIRAQCLLDRFPHAARIRADTFTDAEGVLPDWQPPLTAARRVRELWPTVAKELFAGGLDDGQTAITTWDVRCLYFHLSNRTHVPRFEARRGFVEQVECLTTHWIGDGHLSPVGPLIVAGQPVREVTFSDRECGREGFSWSAVEGAEASPDVLVSNWLPWALAVQFGREDHRQPAPGGRPRRFWYFPNRKAALDALSRAAIAWAEEEAGV